MLLRSSLLRRAAALVLLHATLDLGGVDATRIVFNEDTCFAKVTGDREALALAADPAAPLVCYRYSWGAGLGRGTAEDACFPDTMIAETCAAGTSGCFRRVKYKIQRTYELHGGCGAGDQQAEDGEGGQVTACTTSYCNVGELDPNEGSIGVGWVVFWCVVLAVICCFACVSVVSETRSGGGERP